MFKQTRLFKALSLCVLTVFCTMTLTSTVRAEETPRITHNEPQVVTSEPEPLPIVTESKMATWAWWVLAGVVVAGGGAALAGGGGGGGGGGSSPPATPPPANGTSTVTW